MSAAPLSLRKRVPAGLFLRLAFLQAARKLTGLPTALSFSQTGEDRILSFYLPPRNGFYVDVGAHDPLTYSSTFNLYLRGWSGVAVDANSSLIDRFRRSRPTDICVVAAVSDSVRDATFHRSDTEAVSTIDDTTFQQWKGKWDFRPEDAVTVRTSTLTSILDTSLPHPAPTIDLLTIDVEGHELQVLSGLDFSRYRPGMIAVEIHDLTDIASSPIYQLLTGKGYVLVAYATVNAYFLDPAYTSARSH